MAMAKKDIIIVTNHYKNVKNGVSTVANALVNELAGDFRLLVICPEHEAKKRPGVELRTVKPSGLDISSHHWISFAWKATKVIRSLSQKDYSLVIFLDAREGLFANRIDVPSLGIIHDFMSARFGRLSKELVKTYPDWISRYIYYKCMKRVEERAYSRLNHLVTVCKYAKEQLLKDYKINKPIEVIWNGVDIAHLQPPTGKKEKNTVAFICGNPYLKGLPNLLKAIERVAQSVPDIRCYVIGKKEHMGKLLRSKYAVFVGPQDYGSAMSYLDRSEVYCMPSLFESFGMVYLEALYYNAQVIASKNTGTPEIKKYFRNLTVVDPLDIDQIALAIMTALGKRTKASQKALDIISSKRMGTDYKKLISKLTDVTKNAI